MEKFMLIFQGGMSSHHSAEEMQESMGKWMAWIEKLRKADRYIAGEPLLPGGKLITGKKKTVTDGPYTEGKELVGGFFVIKAKDYNEAVQLCEDYPDYENGGSIQVRQIMKIEVPA
jgi:hypothetical protein